MSDDVPHSAWITLSEAAAILGVHPATVRNWADRGELQVRRTPGGHRRFRRSDVEYWMQIRQTPLPAEVQMLVQNALGQVRLRVSDGDLNRLSWYTRMDEATRQTLRAKGRQMLEALQRYLVDPSDGEGGAPILALGQDYGIFLRQQGLSLTEAIQGFIAFSNVLQEAALNILEVATPRPPGEWIGMLRQVRSFNQDMLLGLVRVYDPGGKEHNHA